MGVSHVHSMDIVTKQDRKEIRRLKRLRSMEKKFTALYPDVAVGITGDQLRIIMSEYMKQYPDKAYELRKTKTKGKPSNTFVPVNDIKELLKRYRMATSMFKVTVRGLEKRDRELSKLRKKNARLYARIEKLQHSDDEQENGDDGQESDEAL